MKQKIGIQHLLKMIHEISLPFVIRQVDLLASKKLTPPMIKMGTIVTKIKSRTFGFNSDTQQCDEPDR